MNSKNLLIGVASTFAAGAIFALAQAPGRGPEGETRPQPQDQFRGPSGPGGPGGRPMMFGGQELELVSKFDSNKDGWLNNEERKAAREHLTKERAESRSGGAGGGGPRFGGRFGGPRGPGGPGGERNVAPPEPGRKVSPSEVKNHGDAPLYSPDVVRTLFLDFENADWEKELSEFHNTDVEVPAKLTVDGKTYEGVGVHFRGMSSYMAIPEGRKRSLNLSVDYVNKDQSLSGYRTLNLLNAHEDPTYLRPILFYDIAREYIPAPKANLVRVVINGEDWGIYDNVQQFNKEFIKENFGTTKGARWKVRGSPGGQGSLAYLGDDPEQYKRIYTIKSKDDPKVWTALIDMIRTLNQTPPEKLEKELSSKLNIDGALKFLALDNALINNDGYWIRTSDYSLYMDEKGKCHVLPQDANETFAKPGGPGGPGGGMRRITPAFMLIRGFFDDGDENQDRELSSKELESLAEHWFAKLDSNKAGKLTRDEFVTAMRQILPEPRFGTPGQNVPPQDPPPNRPNPPTALFEASDSNKDGTVVASELKSTFTGWGKSWDGNENSTLNEEELQKGFTALLPPPPEGADPFRARPAAIVNRAGGPDEGPQPRMMSGPRRNMARVEGVQLDPLVAANDETKPLISKLLAVPALRERYLTYVRDIAEKHLDWKNLGPRAERYHKLIDEYVKADTRKLDSYDAFQKALTEDVSGPAPFGRLGIGLKTFADQRREYLLNYKESK